MRKSISEMAKLSGVSIRTLHYYNEIGLLNPSEVISETGYRYYDENDLMKLQQILFFRELDFSLNEIAKIMTSSEYNKHEAMIKQRELLELKKERLDRLIELLNASLKGEREMSFEEFNTADIEAAKKKYAEEVKQKWGNTDAYAQSQKKTSKYGEAEWNQFNATMDGLLKKFAKHIKDDPSCDAVQKLVGEWQQWITDTYYDCTKEILAGLGQMYVADERFTKNMDKYEVGTAKLISDAIKVYCEK